MTPNQVTLIKTVAATNTWGGNGFGTDRSARYVVKGAEHITVKPVGDKWMARDDKAGKCLCVARTLSEVRKALAH